MCLCKGTGGINTEVIGERGTAIALAFNHCPDSNCTFDKSKSEQKYKEFKKKWGI